MSASCTQGLRFSTKRAKALSFSLQHFPGLQTVQEKQFQQDKTSAGAVLDRVRAVLDQDRFFFRKSRNVYWWSNVKTFLFGVVLGETGHTVTTNATRSRKLPQENPTPLLLHIQNPAAGPAASSKTQCKGASAEPAAGVGRAPHQDMSWGDSDLSPKAQSGAPTESRSSSVPPPPARPIPEEARDTRPGVGTGRECRGQLSPGLGPRARADSKGPHRLSPAATSSSHRGPIVRRLRAFGAVGAALLQETGPAAGRLGPHALSLHALLAQSPEGGRGGQTQR